jgi:hypothetical protein
MPSFLKTNLYFTKHSKFFDKFSPFCFCFCYSSAFKKYNLLSEKYRFIYSQFYIRRRRRYFKYDLDSWTNGKEGFNFKPRFTNFTHVRLRLNKIQNAGLCNPSNIFTKLPSYSPWAVGFEVHDCSDEATSPEL